MNGSRFLWVTLLASVAWSAAAEEWRAVEQPDLKQQIIQAAPLREIGLGVPIYTVQMDGQWWAPNPDGKTHDVVQWYYRNYGGPFTAVVMDLGSGEIKHIRLPLRRQSRGGSVLGPDGKIYLSTVNYPKGMELYVYDPAADEFSSRGLVVPDLTGEKHDLVIGTDGKIYGTGSYANLGKAGAYQIDPDTGKVTVYGPIGPSHKPNGVWGYSLAADDRCVYVASGKIPWYLVAYDRVTGKEKVILQTSRTGEDLQVRQLRHGGMAIVYKGFRGTYVKGGYDRRVEYWLYQGKAIEKKTPNEAPPWPAPKPSKPWTKLPPKPQVFGGRLMPTREGRAEFWYRYPWYKAEAPKTGAEPPGWKVLRFKVPVYPNRRTTFIRELPDGRIFGKSDAYQGNFIYDPAGGELKHLGKIHLSQYSMAVFEGKVYLCGYPSSALFVYDPARPWTANTVKFMQKPVSPWRKKANPHFLLYLRTYSGVHHPYAAAVGADGRLYFGGRWYRDGVGGGLAWYDPHTGKAGGLREPFARYQIHYMTEANDRKWLVISTRAVKDPLHNKPKPPEGKLFVFDTATKKIIRSIAPVQGLDSTGHVVCVGGTRVMGMCNDPRDPTASILYGVDAATGEVAFRKKLPYPLPWRVRHDLHNGGMFDFRLGPDGNVWTFIGNALVKIHPEDARIEVVGMARMGGSIAFSGRDLYMTGSVVLRKEPGKVPAK